MNTEIYTQQSAKSTSTSGKKDKGFTAEEKAAMRSRAKELKASEDTAEAESALLAAIDELKEPDRRMAKRLYTLIKASAPALAPKLWYGMPAYYLDGKLICHFQPAQKFSTRYPTLGFSDKANLDQSDMWPVAYALKELTADVEAKIAALVKKAVS